MGGKAREGMGGGKNVSRIDAGGRDIFFSVFCGRVVCKWMLNWEGVGVGSRLVSEQLTTDFIINKPLEHDVRANGSKTR